MAVLGLAFCLVPTGQQTGLRLLAGASAVVAIAIGFRRNRATDRQPWVLLAAAVGLSTIGTVLYGAVPGLRGTAGTLVIAAYPVLAAVLLVFIRRRAGESLDRSALLDALAVTSGVALLAWTFVLGPRAHDGSWQALAFPLGDLLCIGVLTRLLTAAGRKVPAGNLLGAGLVVMLTADIAYELSLLTGGAEVLAGLGRFGLYAGAGLAALHPSMTTLSEPAEEAAVEAGRLRLALLGLASMVAPAVLLSKIFLDDAVDDLTVVAVLSALTFLLVLVRMAGIMANHRQALARERGLREASAALVSAADTEAVAGAVRTAVAQLLPADTPHGVVLAMAIAQDEPLSTVAFAQAGVDRAAGTAARLVATRNVDWAVAVRLTSFSTTLRCPMVLRDRPTGDPLVGVLHVGAPERALPGLQRAIEVLAGQAALALERIELSHEVIRRNSETYFRTLVQNTSDVILIVDDAARIRYASPSAVRVFGADPTGSPLAAAIHPDDRDRLAEVLTAARGGESQDFRAAAADVLLEMHCSDLRAEPTVAGLVLTLRDVTERRRLELELTHQAFHDSMTGLANRVLFQDRLRHALARGSRDGSVVGVLFIDLDDFKMVNDTLGHAAGDQLLIAVAHRIAGALRADDTAARLGGDEFAALVENVQDPGAVEETAERILTALAEPVQLDDGTSLTAVASIGITTTPEADSADELLRQADLALYVAKGAGKNQWRRYQAHLHAGMVARLELRAALDHAVNEGHFLLEVPADRGPDHRRAGRVRGAGPLVPSDPGGGVAGRVHRGGRGERADRADRPLGAAAGAAHGGPVAPGAAARPAAVHERERLGAAVPRGRFRRRGASGARVRGSAAAGADAGTDRDPVGRRPREGVARPGRAARARHPGGDRRLRHRLLVAGLPAPPPDRRREDRQGVHRRHGGEPATGGPGRRHRAPRAVAGPDGDRRGHRVADPPRPAGAAGLPAGSGLLLVEPGGRHRGAEPDGRPGAAHRRRAPSLSGSDRTGVCSAG